MNLCMDLWGESTGLYFFSAIFQGNMALLALIGVFVVFKIQQLNSRIEHENDVMVRYMRDELPLRIPQCENVPFPYYVDENNVLDVDDILEYLEKWGISTLAVQHLKEEGELKKRQMNCQSFVEQKAIIRKKIKSPIILTLTVIIISLICLPLIHLVHYWYLLLEISIIASVIVLNVVALRSNIRFIMQMVKDS